MMTEWPTAARASHYPAPPFGPSFFIDPRARGCVGETTDIAALLINIYQGVTLGAAQLRKDRETRTHSSA